MRPTVLTIAGSDPGGGAGIQADLKTFAAFGVFGMAAITSLTAQNTLGVLGVHAAPAEFVGLEIDSVLGDIGADAVKTGMLADAGIVEVVAARLAHHRVENVVVDPVMVAKGGAALLAPDAIETCRRRLLPLARLLTPNAAEAEALAGRPVRDLADMREAARRLAGLGPRAVLVKGGHVEVEPGLALDLLFDGGRFEEFRAPRADPRLTHGTGCALSAAIAAGLAHGRPLAEAVAGAKRWLSRALAAAFVPGRGKGHGSPDHAVAPE